MTIHQSKRLANIHDRPCDKCGTPMIGIMKISGARAPRKICAKCGGKAVYDERQKNS